MTGLLLSESGSAGKGNIDYAGEFSGAPGKNFSRELARLIKEN
jgi:hypothetical protein